MHRLVGTDYRGISGLAVLLGIYSGEKAAIAELEKIDVAMKNGEQTYVLK